MSYPEQAQTPQLIVEAAFRSLSQASLNDVLGFLGPKSLSESAHELIQEEQRVGVKAPKAETVAYHFHIEGTERQFDIEALANELLSQACAHIAEAAQNAQDAYLAAAEQFVATKALDSIVDAVDEDLANYRPGSVDALIDARERFYFTAVALCDDGGAIPKKLRETNRETIDASVEVYRRFLSLTGRRIVDGFDERELAALIAMLLEGESLRHRYGCGLPSEKIGLAVIRMFWAFTAPEGSPEVDLQAELTTQLTSP